MHKPKDRLIGQPLCLDCYDYPGAVLWNAHTGVLWRRFTTYLTRALAAGAGLSRAQLRRELRLSYAKVAEYQARGLVHVHSVIRLDGPDGPDMPPPSWAGLDLLVGAVHAAHSATALPPPLPAHREPIGYGRQLDLRPILEFGTGEQITEQRVAGYIAKYATKGAESTGTVDRPIRSPAAIPHLDVNEHARRMIDTCWLLADVPAYCELGLHRWSHMLGFRGHFLTKSRAYSTTLGSLRDARSEHRRGEARARLGIPADLPTVRLGQWVYGGREDNPLARKESA